MCIFEEVKAFGEVGRHPAARVVTIAYCSLINIQHHQLKIHANELHWHRLNTITDMAFDHKKILETCYEWLQKRIQEHPLGFSLLPKKFSLRELQNLYEAILGVKLDRRNFRKKIFFQWACWKIQKNMKQMCHIDPANFINLITTNTKRKKEKHGLGLISKSQILYRTTFHKH